MTLTKHLRNAGFDLIDGSVRNHKPMQIWLKPAFNEAEFYYGDIDHAFNSPVRLNVIEDPAFNVDTTKKDEYGFNIGVSFLDSILKSMGLGNFELSSKIKSGRKVTISYTGSSTKVIALGDITNYLSSADFRHPNPVLLKHANRNNLLVVTGAVLAQNIVVDIETDFSVDSSLVAGLNEAAKGELEFSSNANQKLTMTSNGHGLFPIAVKANRIDYDKGIFKGLTLVTDRGNIF